MSVRPWPGLTLASLAILMTAAGSAQTSAPAPAKVGVVSLQRAVLDSAEIKAASTAMEAKYKPRAAEIEKLQNEIVGIRKKLDAEAAKLTPQAASDLNALGQRRQRELQRLQEDLQGEVDRERQEILQKSSQKMAEMVKKIAEEKGLDMVVDVTNAIYFKPALEITTEVLAAYDKAYPGK
jgi:outer membrane protein